MPRQVDVAAPPRDTPSAAGLLAVAGLAFAVGLGLAKLGVHAARDEAPAVAPPTPDEADVAPSTAEAERPPSEPAATAIAAVVAPEAAAPEVEAPQVAPSEPETPVASPVVAPEPAPAPVAARSAARPVGRSGLTVVPGRVAYLRCEGTRTVPGPFPCPRDPELEAQTWRAIESLAECGTLPAQPGEADVLIDFRAGEPLEVRARDTFRDDVTRVDGPAVVACLTPGLATVQQHLGASRLVVSFRFALR